ncbi:hypothetical protein CYY_007940 [Polysphondylium violaceum]|uniref:Autophagy-related protein 101 n=1 Tax=Polysphondylium violaceum TaxID=133409 RepID=A0A8J4UQI8_9MYCE|nr:hypothetical protein CYY_007940 [Polysphondylium violaceum]
MNFHQYPLKTIYLEYSQLKEVTQCLLHSILFQRSLGNVKPKDVTLDCVEFSYVKIDDINNKLIEEKSEELLSNIMKKKSKNAHQIWFSFYEKREKTTFFSSNSTENVCWEQWILGFVLVPSMAPQDLANQLTDCVQKIIENVNQDKIIPPVTSSNQMTFPFSIQVSGSENTRVTDIVWNMFKTTTQTTNL